MTDEKATRRRPSGRTSDRAWTDEELAAIKEYARERRRAMRPRKGGGKDEADGEADVLAKIAKLDEPDHSMAERLHVIVKAAASGITSKTWYGSPAYYRNGQLICYFQERAKFKVRYAILGFSDKSHLDDGSMWPVVYALSEMTPDVEARITALVKQAVG
jgi:uncharacterized protein YdhG (YjbR/CyaY superfamily)